MFNVKLQKISSLDNKCDLVNLLGYILNFVVYYPD